MSDRIKGFYVVLDSDYREEEIGRIQEAVSMVKHVASVDYVLTGIDDYFARRRVKHEIQMALYGSIDQIFDKDKAVTK